MTLYEDSFIVLSILICFQKQDSNNSQDFFLALSVSMLVKKGQNSSRTVIYTTRQGYRIYTSALVYKQQDWCTYIEIHIYIYTSRFVTLNINQAFQMRRNIKIRVCTLWCVPWYSPRCGHTMKMCRCIKTFLYTLRFVQFGRKGNRDRWINYRVFKWLPRNGSKQGEFSRRCQLACSKPSPPCFAVSTEPWQKCFTSQLK